MKTSIPIRLTRARNWLWLCLWSFLIISLFLISSPAIAAPINLGTPNSDYTIQKTVEQPISGENIGVTGTTEPPPNEPPIKVIWKLFKEPDNCDVARDKKSFICSKDVHGNPGVVVTLPGTPYQDPSNYEYLADPGAETTVEGTPHADGNFNFTLKVSEEKTPKEGQRNYSLDIKPQADLSITKDDGKTSVVPGTPNTYTITVTNNGPSTVSSVTLSDVISSTLLNPVFTPSQGSYNSTSGVWSGLSLAKGNSVTITLSGTIDPIATGSIINKVTVTPPSGVTDTDTSNNTATDTDTLTPQADLSITKDDGKTSVVPGTPNTYTITVTNKGPSTVSSLKLSDASPKLLTPVFGAPSQGSYDSNSGLWSGLTLAKGGIATITLSGTIDPAATGSITNKVTVSAFDDPTTTKTATDKDTLTPQADLSIKNTGPDAAPAGNQVIYTLTASNVGPSAVNNATVTDTSTTGLTIISWIATNGHQGIGNLSDTVSLPRGASVTYTLTATIGSSETNGTVLRNIAAIKAPEVYEDPQQNNSSTQETTVGYCARGVKYKKCEIRSPIGTFKGCQEFTCTKGEWNSVGSCSLINRSCFQPWPGWPGMVR